MDFTAVRTQTGQRFQRFLQRTILVQLCSFIYVRHVVSPEAHLVVGRFTLPPRSPSGWREKC